jgi:hypothetical protein
MNQHTSLDEMNFKYYTEVVTTRARYVETTKFICKVLYSYSTDENEIKSVLLYRSFKGEKKTLNGFVSYT